VTLLPTPIDWRLHRLFVCRLLVKDPGDHKSLNINANI
jgi:hypothetical protein